MKNGIEEIGPLQVVETGTALMRKPSLSIRKIINIQLLEFKAQGILFNTRMASMLTLSTTINSAFCLIRGGINLQVFSIGGAVLRVGIHSSIFLSIARVSTAVQEPGANTIPCNSCI